MAARPACWICRSPAVTLAHRSRGAEGVTADDFRITDARYGVTFDIHRCAACGFLQCAEAADPLAFYEAMDDPVYEETRAARQQQARDVLRRLASYSPAGRLLDIGAGSGILVGEALRRGYAAIGIEPSQWMTAIARQHGLPVETGTLPHPAIAGSFDIVTLVDVVEHVTDPVALLAQARERMAPDGIGLLVTPDVSSIMARLLGWRWWHFRIAHVGYFDRATITLALARAGLEVVQLNRPTWYLPADYLMERLFLYLPRWLRFQPPRLLARIKVPLNLFDSLLVVFRRSAGSASRPGTPA